MPPQPVTQPSTPAMDNDVINLAKAIRQTESGGNFNAKGGSGESGAYQWMPDTWKAHAKQALGNENAEMTPSNQNAVAYTVLKQWKDQGLNPAQIAAKWNSGSEVGWENKRGVNSAGIQYDVPKYVKSVTDAYQTVKAGGQTFADPNNPSSIAAPQPEGDGIFKSMAKAIVSPVATMLARPFQAGAALLGASGESIDKWTKNNLGDWVAPTPKNMGDLKQDVGRGMQTVALGMGPVSGGAAFGTGMSLEQGNDLVSTETAINAGLGLAGGKLLDLVGKPLLNGAGKTIGVITPAILKDVASRGSQAVEKFMAQHSILPESVGGVINKGAQVAEDVANAPFKAAGNVVKKPFTSTPEEVIAGREKALFEIEQKYAGMRKNALYSKDGGASSRKRIADTDVLVGAVDENGLIRTRTPGGAYDQYKAQYVEPGESVVMDLLEKEARSIDLAVVERNLIKAVKDSKLAGKDHLKALNDVKKEIEGYRLKANKDGRIDLAELHRQKIGTTAQINWNTPPVKSAYRKAVAKGLKRTIEKESRYNIREANEELGKYYEDLDFLESLDGKIVNRGRMGKYFAQIAGNIAGGVAGGMSGGMAGSAIGTIVGGELASRIQGIMLSRSLGGAAGKGASRSAILEKAVAESRAPRLALPAPKPGALRSEIKASKPINLAKETDSTRQLKEDQNPKIQTTAKGYQSRGRVEIKGIDEEGNIQIVDKGNVVVIPADELPVIEMGPGPKVKSDLPTIDYDKTPEGPKVSASLKDQRSRKGTQNSQKIASPIKKPSTISDRVQELNKKARGKTFEEFVKTQGTPVYHGTSAENAKGILSNGFALGKGKGVSGAASNDFIYVTPSKSGAGKYVSDRLGIKEPTIIESAISGKTLVIPGNNWDFEVFGEVSKRLGVPLKPDSRGNLTMLDMPAIKLAMKKQGFGSIAFKDRGANGSQAIAVLPDSIKTRSQLTDIWEKANKNSSKTPRKASEGLSGGMRGSENKTTNSKNRSFGSRLSEGYKAMDDELLQNDAKNMSYEEFVKKHEGYNLDAGGMSSGDKPAHATISKYDLEPTEHDSWKEMGVATSIEEFKKTGKMKSPDKQIAQKEVEKYNKKEFTPVLVEEVDGKYMVIDGHHRVWNLINDGVGDIPVYFDRRTLQKMWEKYSGKKISIEEGRRVYNKLFPREKSLPKASEGLNKKQ